ncbi:MurR/RpiR family transcriptional regulator [Peribacillus muralis]|uniref:MurR/RpiR family transcriptional regulator n=1 Tax=Peribacillus muralis TaxID=264697 RepID=UPI001F4ED5B7|nr:MurR/RpiR family transcriptional regulator [Peribacillus muralis]MCK1993817.1 MurR/RpiR family transcriptional regulator [Peribacillus muralis]MCK2013894.1 MurR/RpiR family transcriptional regulator [Peribacillus muralis]
MPTPSLYKLFSQHLDALSAAEKHVFFYIDNHINEIETTTLVNLAEINNVSTTTIIRMCQKLGLKGFSELRYLLQVPKTIKAKNPDKIISVYSNIVQEGISNIDEEKIYNLVDKIIYAPKVYIACLGMTKTIGEYFSKILVTKKKNAVFTYDSFILDILSQIVERDDLIIIISESGNTATTLTLAEHLKFNRSHTVAIVNSPNAPIAQFVDTTIYASTEDFNSELFQYHHAPLMIVIDMILNVFIYKNNLLVK